MIVRETDDKTTEQGTTHNLQSSDQTDRDHTDDYPEGGKCSSLSGWEQPRPGPSHMDF